MVPDLRGNGLGRALLESAMETARGEGAEQMELGTSEGDEAAREPLRARGFINREGGPDGPVMFFYEREALIRSSSAASSTSSCAWNASPPKSSTSSIGDG